MIYMIFTISMKTGVFTAIQQQISLKRWCYNVSMVANQKKALVMLVIWQQKH